MLCCSLHTVCRAQKNIYSPHVKKCVMAVSVAVVVPRMPNYRVLGRERTLVLMIMVLTKIIVVRPTLVKVSQVRRSDPTRWRVKSYPQPLMNVKATDMSRVIVPVV